MMARSTKGSNQRPDTLMQDRTSPNSEKSSCNTRPDHTFGSFSTFSADTTRRLMSALPPTATKSLPRNEPSRRAKNRLTRRSKGRCYSITPSGTLLLGWYPVLKALPNDSLPKVNLTRQVVAPSNRQHTSDKVLPSMLGGCEFHRTSRVEPEENAARDVEGPAFDAGVPLQRAA